LHSNIFAASTSLSVSLFTRAKTSARRSSLVLIAVLFNRTSSGGRSVGDISNGGWRGHYQRGSTRTGHERNTTRMEHGGTRTEPAVVAFKRGESQKCCAILRHGSSVI